MAADEHCPYTATVYNAFTGFKLPVNVMCCSQRDREIFFVKVGSKLANFIELWGMNLELLPTLILTMKILLYNAHFSCEQ